MYNNDVRVANTATPSFNSNPNVTQYGWTNSDQGHYNQLIQYVDECRKIWQDLVDKIEYVDKLLADVPNLEAQILTIRQTADQVAENARQVQTNLIASTTLYNLMERMNNAFQVDYIDFSSKYPDFVTKYEETVLNAAHAAVSATEAEKWYNQSYDIYLDLKNGQVYRGTWNPISGAFPAHGGTNSVWDVVLDAGKDTEDYGGYTWHNGDRLLYILADTKYDQLRTGSGVSSVNNKTGAVTLTAADVGALGATQPSVSTARFTTPVKIAGKEFDGSGDLDIEYYDIGAASRLITVNGQGLDKNVNLTAADVKARPDTWKPLPSEIGAVATEGNGRVHGNFEVTGNLTVQGNEIEFANLNVAGDLSERGHRVYSGGFKPSADELGVVSLTGSNVSRNRHGVDFTNDANSTWIASNHGSSTSDNTAARVVLGTLNNGATVGGHFSDMSEWSALYINTYPSLTSNHEYAPVIMTNPKRQLSIASDTGIPTAIHFPLVSKGVRAGAPNWWIAHWAIRFLDGRDLMIAATNGLRSDPDWVYLRRFKFSVRLTVNAPSLNIWSQVYGFEIYHYQSTNSQDILEVPHQFDCHAGGYRRGVIKKQMVFSTENNGMPYFELHFDNTLDVAGAQDKSVQLEVIAQNIFE